MGLFRLSPLRGDRILQAFPLVCAAGADISIEDWRAYVKSMLSARVREPDCADIIGICSPNKYLRGLFTYMVKPDLHHGRVMEVEYFVVASVYSPLEIAEALIAGVEDEARRHGCKAAAYQELNPMEPRSRIPDLSKRPRRRPQNPRNL